MTTKFHAFNITVAVTSDGNLARLVLVNPDGQTSTFSAPFTSEDADPRSAVKTAMDEALHIIARQMRQFNNDGSY
jgi:hypothetical protein